MLDCMCPFCESRRTIFEAQRDAFEAYQRKTALQKDMERMGFTEIAPGVFTDQEAQSSPWGDFSGVSAPAEQFDQIDAHALAKGQKETDSVLASHRQRMDDLVERVWEMEYALKGRISFLEDRVKKLESQNGAHLARIIEAEKRLTKAVETAYERNEALLGRIEDLEVGRLADRERIASLESKDSVRDEDGLLPEDRLPEN